MCPLCVRRKKILLCADCCVKWIHSLTFWEMKGLTWLITWWFVSPKFLTSLLETWRFRSCHRLSGNKKKKHSHTIHKATFKFHAGCNVQDYRKPTYQNATSSLINFVPVILKEICLSSVWFQGLFLFLLW